MCSFTPQMAVMVTLCWMAAGTWSSMRVPQLGSGMLTTGPVCCGWDGSTVLGSCCHAYGMLVSRR